MPRLPPPDRPGKRGPKRSRGAAVHRYEIWFDDAEDAAVSRALGRNADAAGVRSLALAAAMLLNEKGGDDDRG